MSGTGVGSGVHGGGVRGAGAGSPWGRALRGELMKAVTLPGMWWTAAVTGAAGIAVVMSAFQNSAGGRPFGFEEIAPTWAGGCAVACCWVWMRRDA